MNKNVDKKIEFMSSILDPGAPKFWLTNFFPGFFKIKVLSVFWYIVDGVIQDGILC